MRRFVFLIAIGALLSGAVSSVHAESIAVIVNKTNPVNDLKHALLRRIYRGEMKSWRSGGEIMVLNRQVDSPIRKEFYRIVLMAQPAQEFFQSDTPVSFSATKVNSPRGVLRFVSRIPKAIGYVWLRDVDETVKVLRIDGKLPHEPGYMIAIKENIEEIEE